jgi:hypothetical protein
MRTFKSIQVLLLIIISSISISSYADSQTIVSIKKITTITGSDAERFKKLFGEASLTNPELSIQCGKKSCEITTSRAGFSGEIAKQLLNGRKDVVFLSENQKFKLHCGEAGAPFCNITQEDGVLK